MKKNQKQKTIRTTTASFHQKIVLYQRILQKITSTKITFVVKTFLLLCRLLFHCLLLSSSLLPKNEVLPVIIKKKMSSSSDENNNKSNNDKTKRMLQDRREEMMLVNRFKKAAINKLEGTVKIAEEQGRNGQETGNAFSMGDEELKIVQSLYGVGVKEGIIAGLVTFAILRRGPIYVARYVTKRQFQRQQQQQQQQQQHQQHAPFGNTTMRGGQQQPPPPPQQSPSSTSPPPPPPLGNYGTASPPPPTSSSYKLANPFETAAAVQQSGMTYNPVLDKNFPRSKNFVIRSIWFTFDAVLSLLMAVSVTAAYTNVDKVQQKIVDIPLVEGRSLISDTLCEEIANELLKVQQEQLPVYERLIKEQQQLKKENLNVRREEGWFSGSEKSSTSTYEQPTTHASLYLKGIMDFVANCERRHAMEQRMRQDFGLSKDDPVSIPKPGIPRDAPRLKFDMSNNNNDNYSKDGGDSWSSQTSFDYTDDDGSHGNESDWTTTFVTDQEEEENRKRRS